MHFHCHSKRQSQPTTASKVFFCDGMKNHVRFFVLEYLWIPVTQQSSANIRYLPRLRLQSLWLGYGLAREDYALHTYTGSKSTLAFNISQVLWFLFFFCFVCCHSDPDFCVFFFSFSRQIWAYEPLIVDMFACTHVCVCMNYSKCQMHITFHCLWLWT